jgi:hypothetical protein
MSAAPGGVEMKPAKIDVSPRRANFQNEFLQAVLGASRLQSRRAAGLYQNDTVMSDQRRCGKRRHADHGRQAGKGLTHSDPFWRSQQGTELRTTNAR